MPKEKLYQFSGHETFPLRQLWLYKAIGHSVKAERTGAIPNFAEEEAMVELGVGKNMLSSMRFWAVQSGFLDPRNKLYPTPLGSLVFGEGDGKSGLDPYGESKVTTWITHWNLCSTSNKLTAFWFLFNKVNEQTISRDEFTDRLQEFAKDQGENISSNTIKRDVEVCLRSYAPTLTGRIKGVNEEFVEALLGDLGIVKNISRDQVDISRGRSLLPTPLFIWAMLDMWEKDAKLSNTQSLDWFNIAHGIGSPGKVFRLSEADLYDRLEEIEGLTEGKLSWIDQLGIKSVVKRTGADMSAASLKEKLLKMAYERS